MWKTESMSLSVRLTSNQSSLSNGIDYYLLYRYLCSKITNVVDKTCVCRAEEKMIFDSGTIFLVKEFVIIVVIAIIHMSSFWK